MQKTTKSTETTESTPALQKKPAQAGTRSARRAPTTRKPPVKPPTRAKRPQSLDLDDPALYLNRELTWLEFNRRVLDMAADDDTPLLERVKFLAIVSTNLDEFFMKRVGGLKQQIAAGIRTPSVDGRTPMEQLQ